LGRSKKEVFSPDELAALSQLRSDHCNEAFVADSPDTDRLLVEIWNSAFPDEPITEAVSSERWPRLGFQSNNPRTDVRTGRFALLQFHYFVKTYPDIAQKVVRQAETLEYPLAISAFNLTHMVLVFFDLYDSSTVSPVSGAVQADLQQLKNFACLCKGQGKSVLDELLCVLIQKLHDTWKDMRAQENANLMDFPKAMRKVYDAHALMWSSPIKEVAQLRTIFTE
jgi:hypothetical protein